MSKVLRTEGSVQQSRDEEPRPERDSGQAPAARGEEPRVLDEICVEELAIDGICGVY